MNATLAEADASVAMVYLMHILGATAISAARPGETQAVTPILKEIAAGRHISTLAFSEAGSRSHFWAPMSRAHRNGNGVRISARKSWVTRAGQAHSYVVSALAPEGAGPTNSTLYYLLPAQTRGLAVAGPWDRKNARKPGGGVRRDTFSAWKQALRNYGDFSAILAVIQLDFLQPRLYGGESGILRLPDKHRAILPFFYEVRLSIIVLPSKLADSMRRILPEIVASGSHRYH